jgi:hypothetical protein
MIFVFGSNLAGIHGAGAAKHALDKEGAVWREGRGHHGNSYAIPTKDFNIRSLELTHIESYIHQFILYATTHPHLQFMVTRIGCGLAGYTDEQIAPMFTDAPSNCYFDEAWAEYLPNHQCWG